MTEILVILIVAAAALAVAYPALRHRQGAPPSPAPSEREDLLERKSRVLQALREVEADRTEGNLSEPDYLALKREYEAEAAAILRRLDETGQVAPQGRREPEPAAQIRRPLPALAWGFGLVAFAAIVGVALTQAIRPRDPGGSITGNEIASGMGGGMGGGGGGMGGALVPVDLSRVPELEARIAKDSADVEAMVELGHIFISVQRFREAADLSMRALQVDPRNAQAFAHLGVVLWANGELDPAVEAFDHALELDANLPEALLFKGLVLFTGKQDFPRAVEAWERYLKVAPPGSNTERVRGMLEGARQAAAAQSGR